MAREQREGEPRLYSALPDAETHTDTGTVWPQRREAIPPPQPPSAVSGTQIAPLPQEPPVFHSAHNCALPAHPHVPMAGSHYSSAAIRASDLAAIDSLTHTQLYMEPPPSSPGNDQVWPTGPLGEIQHAQMSPSSTTTIPSRDPSPFSSSDSSMAAGQRAFSPPQAEPGAHHPTSIPSNSQSSTPAVIFLGADLPAHQDCFTQVLAHLPSEPTVQDILDAIKAHQGTELAHSLYLATRDGNLLGVSRVPVDIKSNYRSWRFGYNYIGTLMPIVPYHNPAPEALAGEARSNILELLGQPPTTRLFVLYLSTALKASMNA
ncbi:hypothetical protein BOTBODRAFT_288205 [Botryobasidium botryosum FD-172 SS1]|uniref:Uncharacterized protein n=1 Tax=Botryobasidium botryosum (strain FD-172 SS1) TaxID=930990 RepID=A0A067LRP5_BOTB1|nr:hypothetical protein BOTBODRAFT_288205 [Botryobasidium botryosum FD-172 SS1]